MKLATIAMGRKIRNTPMVIASHPTARRIHVSVPFDSSYAVNIAPASLLSIAVSKIASPAFAG